MMKRLITEWRRCRELARLTDELRVLIRLEGSASFGREAWITRRIEVLQ